jgi:CTP synthase
MARFIFITGGVVSSLGKGLMAASLGALLQARGYKVRIRKFDPYLNVDPGTMSPYQHGEVYVTDDGARPISISAITSGSPAFRPASPTTSPRAHLPRHHRQGAARRLSRRDRPGDPARHQRDQGVRAGRYRGHDFIICEIGGTVGDIESLPFIEAIRQLRNDLGGPTRFRSTPR